MLQKHYSHLLPFLIKMRSSTNCQDSGFSLHRRFLVVNRSHERRRSEPWRVNTQTRKHAARFFFSKEPINYEAASRKAVLLCLMLCAAREQRRHVRVGMRVSVSVETQIVGGGTLGSWRAGVNHEMITRIEQDRNYCHQKHLLLLHAKKNECNWSSRWSP